MYKARGDTVKQIVARHASRNLEVFRFCLYTKTTFSDYIAYHLLKLHFCKNSYGVSFQIVFLSIDRHTLIYQYVRMYTWPQMQNVRFFFQLQVSHTKDTM